MSDAAGPPRVTDAQATYLTVAVPPPSPEAQLAFLQKVQRILAEGDFTATYKFALLIALTELAVEKGDDTGSPLVLATRDIAEKFAELYWGQTVPYRSAGADTEGVLSQVTDDRNARVVSVLSELRQRSGVSTLPAARAHPGWNGALAQLAAVVRAQPLTYLQNVGRETLPFLYTFNAPGTIRLHAGVAFNLRRFQGLIQRLAREGWLSHVRRNRRNVPLLGPAGDLEAFMFGIPRASLAAARPVLAELQSGSCFYCRRSVRGKGDVDHFIPWSRYPRDLAHNFVLAHPDCNARKSDRLGALPHLEQWRARIDRAGSDIARALEPLGFIAEAQCSIVVARWAYRQAFETGGQAWLHGSSLERVTELHVRVLG